MSMAAKRARLALIQTTSRRGKVQCGRSHTRDVRIDTLSENQIEAGEVTLVLRRSPCLTAGHQTFNQKPEAERYLKGGGNHQ